MKLEISRKAVTEEKLLCQNCGHTWKPRKKGSIPARCPKCLRWDWWQKKD